MHLTDIDPVYIGTDLGGTNIVCGAVDSSGAVLVKIKRPTGAARGSRAIMADIAGMIAEVVGMVIAAGGSVAALGIGCPGIVDPERGVSIDSSNLSWRDVPVADELRRLTGLPVYVDNDVRMYVYGEALFGAGKGYSHVLGVTVGTGLASAFVQDGRPFYGSGYVAGELGHISLENIPYVCNCGKTGCFETAVSATGIVRQAVEQLRGGRESLLRARFGPEDGPGFSRLTAADVSDGFDDGDELCREVMARTGYLLGQALAIACMLFSPDVVIVGGGASQAGERLLGPARETLYAGILPVMRPRIELKTAVLTDDAGIIGSALSAARKLQL